MNFNEKLISLRKSKGLSQEGLGAQLKVSRQTISKWESAQSYPDFQRLVLLSDYFGLTLDELVKDVDVQEVREKNASSEKIDAIYQDVRTAKRFVKWYLVAGELPQALSWRCSSILQSTPSLSGEGRRKESRNQSVSCFFFAPNQKLSLVFPHKHTIVSF